MNASGHINISSMCTVFAESEVVSLITSGEPKEKIALGLHLSIAQRLQAMFSKIPLVDDILFVGGRAKNDCLHAILERQLKRTIKRPEEPQIVVALGAALLANDMTAA
ncbi:MAG: FGGY-family carbohydrate kinase [Candidatus Aminicenantes bacterium]|nr:FGGY-family carbohydrate kinase [Candidatus Aminicenantes bacterium]